MFAQRLHSPTGCPSHSADPRWPPAQWWAHPSQQEEERAALEGGAYINVPGNQVLPGTPQVGNEQMGSLTAHQVDRGNLPGQTEGINLRILLLEATSGVWPGLHGLFLGSLGQLVGHLAKQDAAAWNNPLA